ncbi:hypothetical protein [Roseivirga pacifica]|uniref:hypothetical protein n=1 Tax=Roseivirga pacifica TaxID=1267423 RepID=UPI002095CC6F|nr:hypothetical protein [Roseivirga pacifica]MCO6360830.1 hypothetical protein [Roseivirga pacifica]MCO6368719.1 hypothetical protein [Roseivirga pacifica]MCO6372862.1 hypothetical protein [Roseivirga pacifica]MCO6376921.1 hypothetical protein [Roseivirga pacifica]MCO6377801.1 hypothetical protein [Roseivirga pacifica]
MKLQITTLLGTVLLLVSCASTKPASLTPTGPRTIVLNGENWSEEIAGTFSSWYCYDLINTETLGKGPIRFEVGLFGNSSFSDVGFLLYDGGYSGVLTTYRREGLEHRWDWGPNGNEYAFIIQTDGTGLYYDFSIEAKSKPKALYKCAKN